MIQSVNTDDSITSAEKITVDDPSAFSVLSKIDQTGVYDSV